jgi:aminoglycoside phosphotransferase (APT) family kinase protein
MQEIKAMKYVNSNMDVPTSRLHHYFFTAFDPSTSYPCGYMVMDYVEGDTVFDIWESLDAERRTDIVKQGADIVSQLQLHSFEQPGPLGGGRCRGFRFSGYGAGPFHNKDDFNAWFTRKLELSQRCGYASKDFPPFDYSSFTLVHHDICPVNLILDRDGKVWVVDWGNAGAYPAIFEAATMNDSSRFTEFNALMLPHIENGLEERDHTLGAPWTIVTGVYSE